MHSTEHVRRILVADDYPAVAQSIADVIMLACAARCLVDVALDGQEAVDLAAAHRPDAALLDIDMPRLDGIAAARAMRQTYANNPPVLAAMTGNDHAFESARESALFDHVMKKPIEMLRLFDILQLKD
jgi:CheY-like chemotaxis protein